MIIGIKTLPEVLADWQNFYQNVFGLEKDFSGITIPPKREGFGWLVIIAEGLTINQVFEKCSEHMETWRYTENLDQAVTKNDRVPDKDYAIWVRDREEADEELKGLSANQLKEKQISGITLLERLILELFHYFKSWGGHLDVETVTLCSGSRVSGGVVPYVSWDSSDGLCVFWYASDSRNDSMRARAAVSA